MMWPKPTRKVDRALLDTYHDKPCVVCGLPGSDPCHVKSVGAHGDDLPWNVMPACRRHHVEQHQYGWKTMAEDHPAVAFWLQENGWFFNPHNQLRRFA